MLAERWQVCGIDLPGHGQSGGRRGHIDAFSEYVEAIEASLGEIGSSSRPILLAQSMGALVALQVALKNQAELSGLILLSPFLRLRLPVPAWKVWLANHLSKSWPTFSLPTELSGSDMTRDPIAAASYDRDPLNNKKATARWFTETRSAQAQVFARANELRLPCLILHGNADPVADPRASEAFFAQIASVDKTLRMLPDMRHELLHELEPDRTRTLNDIVGWLDRHRPASPPS